MRRDATQPVLLGQFAHIGIVDHEIGSRRGVGRFSLGLNAAAHEPIGLLDDLAHPRCRQAMFLSQVGETLALQKAVDQGYVPIDGRLNPSRRAVFQHHSVCSSACPRPLQILPGQIGAWKTHSCHGLGKVPGRRSCEYERCWRSP